MQRPVTLGGKQTIGFDHGDHVMVLDGNLEIMEADVHASQEGTDYGYGKGDFVPDLTVNYTIIDKSTGKEVEGGRDIADAIGLKVGSAITIGYRASDNASSTGTSASSNEGTGSANDETSSSSSQNSSSDMQGMDMSGDMAGMDMSGSSSSDQSSSSQTSNGQSGQSPSDQPTQDGRVSSDIMDTSGTEFRVAGIVDTGGSEILGWHDADCLCN